MKILRFSKQYKKDVKGFRNQPKKMEKVEEVLRKLRDDCIFSGMFVAKIEIWVERC